MSQTAQTVSRGKFLEEVFEAFPGKDLIKLACVVTRERVVCVEEARVKLTALGARKICGFLHSVWCGGVDSKALDFVIGKLPEIVVKFRSDYDPVRMATTAIANSYRGTVFFHPVLGGVNLTHHAFRRFFYRYDGTYNFFSGQSFDVQSFKKTFEDLFSGSFEEKIEPRHLIHRIVKSGKLARYFRSNGLRFVVVEDAPGVYQLLTVERTKIRPRPL